MDWRSLRRVDLARCLDITEDQVESLIRQGCPGPPFDMSVVMAWKVELELAKMAPTPTGADSEEALERKRHWDAENARLKNLQLQGELIDREEVLRKVTETAHLVRGSLMNLGSELSVSLSRTNDALEIRETIDGAITDKLNTLKYDE